MLLTLLACLFFVGSCDDIIATQHFVDRHTHSIVSKSFPLSTPAPARHVAQFDDEDLVFNYTSQYGVYTATGALLEGVDELSRFGVSSWLNAPIETAFWYENDSTPVSHYMPPNAFQSQADFARHTLYAQIPFSTKVDTVVASTTRDQPSHCLLAALSSTHGDTPLWEMDWDDCVTPADGLAHSPAISDNGQVVAFVAFFPNATGAYFPKLFILDALTGNLLWTFAPDFQGGASVAISADGRVTVFSVGTSIYVVESLTGKRRMPFPIANTESCSGVSLSFDGANIVLGCAKAELYSYNGNMYKFVKEFVAEGFFMLANAMSPFRGGMFTLGWVRSSDVKQARVDLYDLQTLKLIWAWLGPENQGQVQTSVSRLSMSLDFIAVTLWGDFIDQATPSTSPTVLLFRSDAPTPVFSFVSPGSMFAVSVAADAEDSRRTGLVPVWLTAGGKHIHANAMGNGGDSYGWKLVFEAQADCHPDPA